MLERIPARVVERLRRNESVRLGRPYYVIADDTGCWNWFLAPMATGYGQVCWQADERKVTALAHRVMYELHVGPIPDGLQIDHLCRNRRCCNPAHLEAVTPKENTRRGNAMFVNGAREAAKTHCPKGHPYDDTNTYVAANGSRICRSCRRARERTRRGRHS